MPLLSLALLFLSFGHCEGGGNIIFSEQFHKNNSKWVSVYGQFGTLEPLEIPFPTNYLVTDQEILTHSTPNEPVVMK